MDKVTKAVVNAIRLRRHNRDIIAQCLYPDTPISPPTFPLDGREHLQGVYVCVPGLSVYAVMFGQQVLCTGGILYGEQS